MVRSRVVSGGHGANVCGLVLDRGGEAMRHDEIGELVASGVGGAAAVGKGIVPVPVDVYGVLLLVGGGSGECSDQGDAGSDFQDTSVPEARAVQIVELTGS